MMAAIQGHEAIVRLLLQAGADPDVRVHGGYTAAELAARYTHVSLSRMLLCAQRRYAGAAIVARCS
jgi:ankyrin repeat protein